MQNLRNKECFAVKKVKLLISKFKRLNEDFIVENIYKNQIILKKQLKIDLRKKVTICAIYYLEKNTIKLFDYMKD